MTKSRENLHKKERLQGFTLSLKIFVPLSIISFFNEFANGQFCMWGGCEPYPFYYHYPKIIALCFTCILVFLSDSSREKPEEKGYANGILVGMIIGVLMFLLASVIGWTQGAT